MEDKLYVVAKGIIAKLIIGIATEIPEFLILSEFILAMEDILPLLREKEGLDKISRADLAKWAIEYNKQSVLLEAIPEEHRKKYIRDMEIMYHELASEEKDKKDLSVFETFLDGLDEL